jgi:hypothetical protein
MPFLHQHKLLFVHIPKTGGTSIEEKFNINHNNNELFSHIERIVDGTLYAPQHWTPYIIKNRFPEQFEEYKKFCFVRNPYTKIISEYFWCRTHAGPRYGTENKTIDEFIKTLNPFTRDHLLPQYRYFENIEYDYVLRNESLNEDFAIMAEDFSFDGTLPHSNKNKVGLKKEGIDHYIKQVNSESIETINRLYRKDFELFNYEMVKP